MTASRSERQRSCCRRWDSDPRPSLAQALPSLDGIPKEYSHELQAELVYELCAALVRFGLGTSET